MVRDWSQNWMGWEQFTLPAVEAQSTIAEVMGMAPKGCCREVARITKNKIRFIFGNILNRLKSGMGCLNFSLPFFINWSAKLSAISQLTFKLVWCVRKRKKRSKRIMSNRLREGVNNYLLLGRVVRLNVVLLKKTQVKVSKLLTFCSESVSICAICFTWRLFQFCTCLMAPQFSPSKN